MSPLIIFVRAARGHTGLTDGTADRLVRASVDIVCEDYSSLCLEVIESARKTAAGLGRIKTRRKKASGADAETAVPLSDTEKIRVQLRLDVAHLGVLFSQDFQVQPDAVPSYCKLRKSVEVEVQVDVEVDAEVDAEAEAYAEGDVDGEGIAEAEAGAQQQQRK